MTLSPEQAELQERLGLPREVLFRPRIQYSHARGVLVLSFTLKTAQGYVGRIFQRQAHEESYVPVVRSQSEGLSFESPVIADRGVLFLLEYEAGNFKKLTRIDFSQSTIGECQSTELEHGMFFAELAGADDVGAVVYGVAGFYPAQGIGPVPYHLVSYTWETGQTRRLATMEGAFF